MQMNRGSPGKRDRPAVLFQLKPTKSWRPSRTMALLKTHLKNRPRCCHSVALRDLQSILLQLSKTAETGRIEARGPPINK